MLRRYLIVNGLTSAVFYAAIWALLPSMNAVTQVLSETWETYVMGHTFLGPVFHRIITVGTNFAGLF